jgi:ATP-binding cassette subfamily C (CFTR/MRP) protein 1
VVPSARRGEVTVDELPLPSAQQAEPAFEEFDRNWEEALRSAPNGENPKLMKVRVWWGTLVWAPV